MAILGVSLVSLVLFLAALAVFVLIVVGCFYVLVVSIALFIVPASDYI
jgi:hypothetical protein